MLCANPPSAELTPIFATFPIFQAGRLFAEAPPGVLANERHAEAIATRRWVLCDELNIFARLFFRAALCVRPSLTAKSLTGWLENIQIGTRYVGADGWGPCRFFRICYVRRMRATLNFDLKLCFQKSKNAIMSFTGY